MANYTDNLTLDEIGENDLEMAKDAIKNANKYSFGSHMKKSVLFVKHCLDTTLKHLGITVNPPKDKSSRKMYAHILDKQLEEKNIKIEHRKKYVGKEIWRNGLYISQDDVLVAFISDVIRVSQERLTKDKLRLLKESVGYYVVTNARTDNVKRIYTPNPIKKVESLIPPSLKNNVKLLH